MYDTNIMTINFWNLASKNITRKKIKFLFKWISWMFDMTSDVQDGTIIQFTNESFSNEQYFTQD